MLDMLDNRCKSPLSWPDQDTLVTPGEDGVTDFKVKQTAYVTGILRGLLRENKRAGCVARVQENLS